MYCILKDKDSIIIFSMLKERQYNDIQYNALYTILKERQYIDIANV